MFWSAPTVADNLAIDDAAATFGMDDGTRANCAFGGAGRRPWSMGSSERPQQVVHAEACASLGVEVLKRSTGGGSVLQTGRRAELLAGHARSHELGPEGRLSSRHRPHLCDPRGLRSTWQAGRHIRMWRWATARSQGTRRPGAGRPLLVHGTLLVDFDYELAEAVLKHPPREPAYRQGRFHRDFLTTLRSLRVHTDRDSIERAALTASRQVFGEIKVLHNLSPDHLPIHASAGSLP